jgi:fatty-acid desaturase
MATTTATPPTEDTAPRQTAASLPRQSALAPEPEDGSETLNRPVSSRLNAVFTVSLVVFHVLAVAALFMFHWSSLAVFAILWILGQNVGIAIGYHRLLTHRGYQVPRWLEYFIAICGTMAFQGGPIYWVAVHRLHHQHTDRPGDPHSPRDGAWWAHMGWILHGSLHNQSPVLKRYAPDLIAQPFYRWLSAWHWVPVTLVGVGLLFGGAAWGGWGLHGWMLGISWVLWGVFLRATAGLHVTWLVNSATHMWGRRRYETKDDSTNNWWVALLTGGEGWHNNHHAHPVSARHGLAWWEFDPNYYAIWLLEKVGLARKVYVKSL